MKRFVLCLAASVAVGLSGLAPGLQADEPAKEKKADPAAEFTALQKEWADAQQTF